MGTDLILNVYVGARSSSEQFHIFQLNEYLPKFALFLNIPGPEQSHDDPSLPAPNEPSSYVSFTLKDQIHKLQSWIENSFLLLNENIDIDGNKHKNSLAYYFADLKQDENISNGIRQQLWIQARKKDGIQVQIRCDSMKLAAEIVQDICKFMNVTELSSVANFPREMDSFKQVLLKVGDYNALRIKFTAEMADVSTRVKALVIKAEDARIIGDMPVCHSTYILFIVDLYIF